ncbi:UNVERIFIED_CONTAM: hypothetical protein RMT77_008764 [Armadillidium vulgare]
MKYASIVVFLLIAYLCDTGKADKITKEECEGKGGKFCASAGMCYLPLLDEVTSYQVAEDLCKEKNSVLPFFHLQDYVNFTKCNLHLE